ncbi:MAG: hypothetical protein IJM33_03660 [Bacteroidales bacterium]|nr:hypothetical protein [Bacteroidales bacterium]
MRHTRRNILLALIALMLLTTLAACSNKGVHMPKHRKRRHCDCPTFTETYTSHPYNLNSTCPLTNTSLS